MQMSAIADTSNFINMLEKFLPSFLVTLERKNCCTLKNVETLTNVFLLA